MKEPIQELDQIIARYHRWEQEAWDHAERKTEVYQETERRVLRRIIRTVLATSTCKCLIMADIRCNIWNELKEDMGISQVNEMEE